MGGIHDCLDGIEICDAHIWSTIHHPFGLISSFAQVDGHNHTDVATEIRRLEHFDAQILLHFAHDFGGVVELEVCVLGSLLAIGVVRMYALASRHCASSTSSHLHAFRGVCAGSLVFCIVSDLTVLGPLTLFKCTVILPFASMVAVSPRNDTTLPRMRTVWLVKEPRYLALTRGVASDMVSGLGERGLGKR